MKSSSNRAIRKAVAIESGIVNFLLSSLRNGERDLVKDWVCANCLSNKAQKEYFNSSYKAIISMCIQHHEADIAQTLTQILSEIRDQGLLSKGLEIMDQMQRTLSDNNYAENLLGDMRSIIDETDCS